MRWCTPMPIIKLACSAAFLFMICFGVNQIEHLGREDGDVFLARHFLTQRNTSNGTEGLRARGVARNLVTQRLLSEEGGHTDGSTTGCFNGWFRNEGRYNGWRCDDFQFADHEHVTAVIRGELLTATDVHPHLGHTRRSI